MEQAINDLENMSLAEVTGKLQLPDQDFDGWLGELGLLHRRQTCNTCGNVMAKSTTRPGWVCHRRECRNGSTKPSKSYYSGTFFEKSKIRTKSIFYLSYYWCHQYGTIANQEYETGISSHSIVQWHQYFRDVCAEYFVRNPQKIGGPGRVNIT